MCILLKVDYAKFSVFNLFSSNVIEEKPLEDPIPFSTGRVKMPELRKGTVRPGPDGIKT